MSRIKDVLVPDIGEFDAVEVIEVLVKSGDTVAVEDPLITMESDKASMDVPSPLAGTVKDLKINAGDKVSQNDLILTLKVEESAQDTAGMPAETTEKTSPQSSSSTSTTSVTAPQQTGEAAIVKAESVSSESSPAERVRRPPPMVMPVEQKDFLRAHASPSIRKFARELGVDLSRVHGSGRKQRITIDDVQEFVKQAV
ncbi:MAG: biotin/lipoyl-containing protein, partial [SAR324 cluster bacterium]|nr:biotin/lipoyl-containing protein [SAR324 cluster bacterium]